MNEETRNQVTVKKGPLVYCVESADLPNGLKVTDIAIPLNAQWKTIDKKIGIGNVKGLEAIVTQLPKQDWKNSLYKEVGKTTKPVTIQMIPYFSWANRGNGDMAVWMPLIR